MAYIDLWWASGSWPGFEGGCYGDRQGSSRSGDPELRLGPCGSFPVVKCMTGVDAGFSFFWGGGEGRGVHTLGPMLHSHKEVSHYRPDTRMAISYVRISPV